MTAFSFSCKAPTHMELDGVDFWQLVFHVANPDPVNIDTYDVQICKRHIKDKVVPWCFANLEGHFAHYSYGTLFFRDHGDAMLAHIAFK